MGCYHSIVYRTPLCDGFSPDVWGNDMHKVVLCI